MLAIEQEVNSNVGEPTNIDFVTTMRPERPSGKVILLRNDGPVLESVLAKQVKAEGKPYPKRGHARLHRVEECAINCLDDIVTVGKSPNIFFIHGRLKAGGKKSTVLRRAVNFDEAAHYWIAIDLDELDCTLDDGDAVARHARALLPAEFRTARLAWNLTGSHLLKDGRARIRLWFWCNRQVSRIESKAWLSGATVKADPALWACSTQPIYLAPVVLQRVGSKVVPGPDPIPMRWGLVEGDELVAVPVDLAAKVMEAQTRGRKAPTNVIPDTPHVVTAAVRALLKQRNATRNQGKGRNNTIRAIAQDFHDYGVSLETCAAIVLAWVHADDAIWARDLSTLLRELGCADADELVARIVELGLENEAEGAWAGEADFDDDDIVNQLGQGYSGAQNGFGCIPVDDPAKRGVEFGAVADEDDGGARTPPSGLAPIEAWLSTFNAEHAQTYLDSIAGADDALRGELVASMALITDHAIDRDMGASTPAEDDAAAAIVERLKAHALAKTVEKAKPSRRKLDYDKTAKTKMAVIVEKRLVEKCSDLYERAGELQRIVVREETRNGTTRLVAGFVRVESAYLAARIDEFMQLGAVDAKGKPYVIPAPRDLCDLILQRHGDRAFKTVRGIISTPTLRPDGTLLDKPGYDAATGLFLVGGLDMPVIDAEPSREAALAAMGLIKGLFDETPTVDDASKSVLIAALLTVVGRGAFSVCPAFVSSAPAAGSGKSYANELIELIATGFAPVVASTGSTTEEMEKRMDGALLAGRPIINLDNISSEMRGDKLAQAISSEALSIRPLGRSDIVSVHNSSTILGSGNNVRVVADLTRRILIASLDARLERPELRQFARDPKAEVAADRGKYVAAVLTILLGFLHGKRSGSAACVDRLGGFGEWSDLVRSAIVWLGEADPVLTLNTARASDPVAEARLAIFSALRGAFDKQPFTVKAAMAHNPGGSEFVQVEGVEERPSVRDAFTDHLGEQFASSSMKVAAWLSREKNSIIGGLRLEEAGRDNKVKSPLWRVVAID